MRFAYGLNITWSKPRFAIGAGGFNESIVWRRENREQSNTLLLLRSRKMMYSFLFFYDDARCRMGWFTHNIFCRHVMVCLKCC
jgi:hypothetical protein